MGFFFEQFEKEKQRRLANRFCARSEPSPSRRESHQDRPPAAKPDLRPRGSLGTRPYLIWSNPKADTNE